MSKKSQRARRAHIVGTIGKNEIKSHFGLTTDRIVQYWVKEGFPRAKVLEIWEMCKEQRLGVSLDEARSLTTGSGK